MSLLLRVLMVWVGIQGLFKMLQDGNKQISYKAVAKKEMEMYVLVFSSMCLF